MTSLSGNTVAHISNAEFENLSGRQNSTITVNNGSSIREISAYNNSTLTINSGSLGEWGIYGTDNSLISMYGGSTWHYSIYRTSTGFLYGGSVTEGISAGGDATLTMKNGTVKDYSTQNNALGVIEGGTVENIITAFGDSHIDIKGGEILNQLRVFENGEINLYGSDFYVNGDPIAYGEGIFEVFGDTLAFSGSRYSGRITGTLADGTLLDNDFYIYNIGSWEGVADIYIIPEPTTLLLLGMGGMLIGKRK